MACRAATLRAPSVRFADISPASQGRRRLAAGAALKLKRLNGGRRLPPPFAAAVSAKRTEEAPLKEIAA